MAPKLSDLLINEGLINPQQLEEALKCQVIFGGRLGTNLVEMNMVKETDVIRCLSEQLARPFVTPEQLMSVPPDIIALISKELAQEFKIVPLSLEKRRLTVAMMNPADLVAIDKISFITGYVIVPVVCSELRLLHALEQYYGIRRELRFIRLSGETGPGTRSKEAVPSNLATYEDDMSPDWMDLALLDIPSGGEEVLDLEEPMPQITAQAESSPLAAVMAPTPTAAGFELIDPLSEVMWPVRTEAREPDEIAKSVADYVYQNAERVALFMVKGRMAAGWKAHIRKKAVTGFENFQLALDEASALRVVTDTRSFYLGPLLDTAGNQKLLAALGGGAPERALLMPLMMMGRVVMIFYLDGGTELARDLESLLNTADMAGLAVEMLHFLSSSNSTMGHDSCH